MKKVTKAVIPAAGFGTRFLPITKSVCKEMLPIVDKPTLQYIIEEAVQSGITDILIVTGRNKKILEDFFDYTPELDALLEQDNKIKLLKISKEIEKMVNLYFVRQKHPCGFANALQYAKAFTGDEPFAILLGDDIIYTDSNTKPVTQQLIENYYKYQKPTLALMEVDDKDINKYANIKARKTDGKSCDIALIVEKPKAENKFSNYAVIGRYIVGSDIYNLIDNLKPSETGETFFTEALQALAKENRLTGYQFAGKRYDAGDKLEYLIANVEYALRDFNLQKEFTNYLKNLVAKL